MEACLKEHPKKLARLLYPACSEDGLVAEMSSFAQTYDDTACFLKRIPTIVHAIFGQEETGGLSRRQKRWLEGLAFETLGANTDWYLRTGSFSDAAVLIWLCRLCCSDQEYWAGVDSSFFGLTGYLLAKPRRPRVAEVVRDALRDVVVQYSWQSFLDAMITYLAANKVAPETAPVVEVVSDKLRQTSNLEDSILLLEEWWDFKEGAFCEFGRESIASHFDLARPGRAMPVPTEEYGYIRCKLREAFRITQRYFAEKSEFRGHHT